ncbi:zinc carboxypeptidase [Manduca sexta]|uniref:zinc carboxypeptidase n=1 Tax=Manduca sexta TaxID=7130 RepID=UPI0018904A87|nr:zinc carboxypeptidase [Manduca sexta]
MIPKLILSLLLISFASCEKFRFDNYTLYKILPKNLNEVKVLKNLYDSDARFDFWKHPAPNAEYVTVVSAPKDKGELEGLLNRNGISFEIAMQNIQEAMDKETVGQYTRSNIRSMRWDRYYPIEQVYAWLDDLAREYPSLVTIEIAGHSYEGRDIKGVKISHGEGRRIIFLETNTHSREWIAVTSVCYLINELLTSTDPETMAAAREFDWYIFPSANPDGFAWTHTGYRLWRKNRRPVGQNLEEIGVDLNRNWNSNWLVWGSAIDPSLINYAGPGPFSEPETRTLATYLRSLKGRIDMYLSMHAAGQMLLIPYGNTSEPLDNYYDALNIGRRAMGALSVRYGTEYTTGNVVEVIDRITGLTADWVKEHLKVPLVYMYELRDKGTYGHLIPPELILPSAEETTDSIIDLIHQAKRFGYMNSGNSINVSFGMKIVCSIMVLRKLL